jgi:hypothetical protein
LFDKAESDEPELVSLVSHILSNYLFDNYLALKAESDEPELVSLVSHTLRHASLSMLVTSLTTTAAFFGSVVSNITAIKCFRYF